MGLKTPLFSPILYFLRLRKDLFLVAFSVYCLALGFEIEVASVYTMDVFVVFSIILSSILLLDEGLKGDNDKSTYLIVLILLGALSKWLYVLAMLFVFLYNFSEDAPRRGVLSALAFMSLLVSGLILGKNALNVLGGVSAQVVFISAVSVLIASLFWSQAEKWKL